MTNEDKIIIKAMQPELFQKNLDAFNFWHDALDNELKLLLERNVDEITIEVNKKIMMLSNIRKEKIRKLNANNR